MLMNRFYKHLFPEEISGFWSRFLGGEDQQSPAKAMQMAKRSLMQQKKYRHPYYWAPFIVIKGI
jgi:CHAT domain-containing protein